MPRAFHCGEVLVGCMDESPADATAVSRCGDTAARRRCLHIAGGHRRVTPLLRQRKLLRRRPPRPGAHPAVLGVVDPLRTRGTAPPVLGYRRPWADVSARGW